MGPANGSARPIWPPGAEKVLQGRMAVAAPLRYILDPGTGLVAHVDPRHINTQWSIPFVGFVGEFSGRGYDVHTKEGMEDKHQDCSCSGP